MEIRNEIEGIVIKFEYLNVNCDYEMIVCEKSVCDCIWIMKVNGFLINEILLDFFYVKNFLDSLCGYDFSCYLVGLGCMGNERNLCLENYFKDDI